jgi:hypothetical protein
MVFFASIQLKIVQVLGRLKVVMPDFLPFERVRYADE